MEKKEKLCNLLGISKSSTLEEISDSLLNYKKIFHLKPKKNQKTQIDEMEKMLQSIEMMDKNTEYSTNNTCTFIAKFFGGKSIMLYSFLILGLSFLIFLILYQLQLKKSNDPKFIIHQAIMKFQRQLMKMDNRTELLSLINNIGSNLNKSKYSQLIINDLQVSMDGTMIHKAIINLSSLCQIEQNAQTILYLLYFVHDFITSGGTFNLSPELINHLLDYCYLTETITTVLFSLISKQMKISPIHNISDSIHRYTLKLGFGPWIRHVSSYYIDLSQFGYEGSDITNIHHFIRFIAHSHESWAKDTYTYFCSLIKQSNFDISIPEESIQSIYISNCPSSQQ